MRAHVRIAAIASAVVALAACGGSGGATLTNAEYAAKLSRLCERASDQVRELHLDTTLASWQADGARLLKIEESFKTKLAGLRPPASIKDAAAGYAQANDKAMADTQAAVAAARAGDAGKLHLEITQSNRDDLATFPAARQIGAKGCYVG